MENLLREFDAEQLRYARLLRVLEALVSQILDHVGVEGLRVEGRVKSRSSFSEKINRPDKVGKYQRLSDITDICGIRIVVLSKEDCDRVVNGLRKEFEVDEINSVDKSKSHDDDRFGYSSTHLVVSLPSHRIKLFENEGLGDIKAEIQVRTVLQHAWAAFDWQLRYKSSVDVPKAIKRKLFQLSALLETTDDAFSEIQRSLSSLRIGYEADPSGISGVVEINKDSLLAYFRTSRVISDAFEKMSNIGVAATMNFDEKDTTPWSYLISSLAQSGIETIQDLDAVMLSLSDQNYDLLLRVHELWGGGGRIFGGYSPIRILVLSTLPREQARRVIAAVPSGPELDVAERAVLEA